MSTAVQATTSRSQPERQGIIASTPRARGTNVAVPATFDLAELIRLSPRSHAGAAGCRCPRLGCPAAGSRRAGPPSDLALYAPRPPAVASQRGCLPAPSATRSVRHRSSASGDFSPRAAYRRRRPAARGGLCQRRPDTARGRPPSVTTCGRAGDLQRARRRACSARASRRSGRPPRNLLRDQPRAPVRLGEVRASHRCARRAVDRRVGDGRDRQTSCQRAGTAPPVGRRRGRFPPPGGRRARARGTGAASAVALAEPVRSRARRRW